MLGCCMPLEADLLLHVCVCLCRVDGRPAGRDRSQLAGYAVNIRRGNWSNLWAALSSGGVREVLLSDYHRYEMGRRKLRAKCRTWGRLLPLSAAS